MDASLRGDINQCINELDSIVRQLNAVSQDVRESVEGVNTRAFTRSLENIANQYRSAANKLRSIK